MISTKSFEQITAALLKYHRELRDLENNLNVSFDDNWMVHIMDNVIKGLSYSFHEDKDFEGFCYNELTSAQVAKINEFLQYFVYAWECGEEPPAWIVYERYNVIEGPLKLECRCQCDAYKIIKDFIEHPQDDVTWRLEDI